jgi:hypothetical protein
MVILNSGNVGIGTTSPGAKLHVFNAGYPQVALQSNGGTWQLGVSTGNEFTIRRGTLGSNYPLWINNSDNVGIGTTTPTSRLQVKGSGTTSATTALRVENTNASASLVVLDNGYVGIGTGSAQYQLDINGTTRINGNALIAISSSGISNNLEIYSTSDTTTNYQRGRLFISSNTVNLLSEWSGTGAAADLGLYSGLTGRGITVRRDGGSSGHIQFNVAVNTAPDNGNPVALLFTLFLTSSDSLGSSSSGT